MNPPASAAGSFPIIVVTFVDSVNADSAVIAPLEVVCGPITASEATFSAVHASSDRPPHQVLHNFHLYEHCLGHVGAGGSSPSRAIR